MNNNAIPRYDCDNTEKLKKEMGIRLKEAINKCGYTQEDFAEACGITYPTLRSYILGKYFYRTDVLINASKLLNVSCEYLLCEKEEEIEPIKKFAQYTHLSEKASKQFVSIIAEDNNSCYNEATHIIRALSDLLENRKLISTIANFFWYSRNKNVTYKSAIDKNEFNYFSEDAFKHYKIDNDIMKKLCLYELLTAFEAEEKKLTNKNLESKERN